MTFCSIYLNAQISTFIKTYNNYDAVYVNTIDNKNYISFSAVVGNTNVISQLTDDGDTINSRILNIQNKTSLFGGKNGYFQNNILVSTTTYPYAPNVYGFVFTKADSNFNFSVLKTYIRASSNAFSLFPTELSDSSFIFTGLTSQNTNSIYPWDIAVMKTDKNGNTLWSKKYDMGYSDANNGSIMVNVDKSMLIIGSTELTGSADDSDILLLKIDSLGNQLWARAIGGYGIDGGKLFRINNYYYSVGSSRSYGGANSSGICIYKIDTMGNLINAKYIFGALQPQSSSVEYNNNGTFTLTGISDYPSGTSWDFIAMHIDTNGVVLNNKIYSLGAGADYGINFVSTNDGGYIFNCIDYTGTQKQKLFKTDSMFNSGCLPSYSASFTTTDVTILTHDTAIVMAVTNIPIIVGVDTILETTDVYNLTTNCFGYVGIEDQKEQKNEIFVYPNPNNGNMELEYSFSSSEQATFILYDITGREIVRYPLNANANHLTISETTLRNGIYFYKVISENELIGSDKIIIINK